MKTGGLVFGGGGVRGISFLGALSRLKERGEIDTEKVNDFAGISAGAAVSVLLAIGYSPEEIFEEILHTNLSDLLSVSVFTLAKNMGLDDGTRIMNWMEKMFVKKRVPVGMTFSHLFSRLNKSLRVLVSNIYTMKPEILSHETTPDMEVLFSVRMSMSVPFVFTPVTYNGCMYVDGALLGCVDDLRREDSTVFVLSDVAESQASVKDIYQYGLQIIRCAASLNGHKNIREGDVCIKSNKEHTLNFRVTEKDKLSLFESGKYSV